LGTVRVAEKLLERNLGHGFEGEKIGVIHALLTVLKTGPPELEGPMDEEPAEVLLDMGGVTVPGEQVGNTVDEDRLGTRHMEAMVFGDGLEFGEFVLTEADIVTEILGVFEAKIGGRGGGYRGAFDHRLAPGGGDGCDTEELLDLRVEFLRVGAWVGRKGRKEVEQGSGEGRAHLGDIREDIVCDHN
jgi:hypothetical protein